MEGGTMESYMNRISNTGIVPVVKILEKEDAYPLAKALLNGGIDVIEVTYRSEHATSAIQTISEQLPDMLVGAGTVLSVEQAKEAVEAGAKFIITPGFNTKVVQWCVGTCTNLFEVSEFNHHPEYRKGILESECSDLLKHFFKKKRDMKKKQKS